MENDKEKEKNKEHGETNLCSTDEGMIRIYSSKLSLESKISQSNSILRDHSERCLDQKFLILLIKYINLLDVLVWISIRSFRAWVVNI